MSDSKHDLKLFARKQQEQLRETFKCTIFLLTKRAWLTPSQVRLLTETLVNRADEFSGDWWTRKSAEIVDLSDSECNDSFTEAALIDFYADYSRHLWCEGSAIVMAMDRATSEDVVAEAANERIMHTQPVSFAVN